MKQTLNFNITVPELGDSPDITQVSDAIQSMEDALAGTVEFMNASVSGTEITLSSPTRITNRIRYYDGMTIRFTSSVQLSANYIQTVKIDGLIAQPLSIPFLVIVDDTITIMYSGGSFVAKYDAIPRSTSTDSTSITTVGTSSSVKVAYDRGSLGVTNAGIAQTKADSAYDLAETKETAFSKNSGFNLNKSDAINLNDSNTIATSKAAKTAYDRGTSGVDKANQAYTLASGKEPIFSKKSGFNLNISHLINSTSKILVASAYAVKLAFDKGVEALGLANTNKNAIQNNTEQIENLNSYTTISVGNTASAHGWLTLSEPFTNFNEIIIEIGNIGGTLKVDKFFSSFYPEFLVLSDNEGINADDGDYYITSGALGYQTVKFGTNETRIGFFNSINGNVNRVFRIIGKK